MALNLAVIHLAPIVLETHLVAQHREIDCVLDLIQRLEFGDIVLGVEPACACIRKRGVCIFVHG